MQVYHIDNAVIAVHGADQVIPAGVYGDARLLVVPDGVNLDVSVDGALVVPSDLNAVKAIALATISAWKRASQDGGFDYRGKRFDSDARSVQAISSAVQMAQIGIAGGHEVTVPWVTADNSTLELDATGLVGLGVAGFQHFATCHAQALAHKEAVHAAESTDAVIDVLRAVGAW